ncbi:MAG: hypothetical protein ABSD47_14725 [Candidatus Methylomirabilota bacterium]
MRVSRDRRIGEGVIGERRPAQSRCCELPGDYLAAEVLAKARAGMAKEHQVRERIQQGEYLFDMLRPGDVLKGLNVVEE